MRTRRLPLAAFEVSRRSAAARRRVRSRLRGAPAAVHGRTSVAYLFTLLAVLGALGACSGDSSSEPAATGSPTSPAASAPSSPTPVLDPVGAAEDAALEAYRGMWDAYVEAISIPDPELPALARFAADDALTVLVDGLEQVERDGLAGRGDVVLDPEVTELSPPDAPTAAEILDCVDDSGTELFRVDGRPYEDTPGGLRRAEATVHSVGDSEWKVIGFALYGVGSCEE